MSAVINGEKYYFLAVDYIGAGSKKDGVLAAGTVSYPGLLQVFLDPSVTSQEIAAFGETYDVLVYAQAVQVEGFTNHAQAFDMSFGAPTAQNNPWA